MLLMLISILFCKEKILKQVIVNKDSGIPHLVPASPILKKYCSLWVSHKMNDYGFSRNAVRPKLFRQRIVIITGVIFVVALLFLFKSKPDASSSIRYS
jgi:hypothetical protein